VKNIVIFGYFGQGNLGDETNLQQLIEALRELIPEAKITVISAVPELTAQEHQVVGVGKLNVLGIIRALVEADLLIGNAGSHFQDITSKRSLYYYSALIIIAKLLKVRIFLYGQGVGPIKSRIGKKLAGRVLSMVDVITVRDRLSIVTASELNVRKPEIHFTAEPLLALKGLEAHRVGHYWKNRDSGEKRRIGLVIGDLPFIKKGFWDQLFVCLGWESNLEIYLVPVQPKDRDYLQELSANYGLTVLPSDSGWEQLQQVAGGLDLLVSVRLHGLVAGVLQGIPCYGLAMDPKIEGFCLQLGIPFSSLSFETEWMVICNKISDYLNDSSGEALVYRAKLPFWKARALENQIILKQFLKKI
jgi:polysaccharide pyruvyl transferase CsaB